MQLNIQPRCIVFTMQDGDAAGYANPCAGNEGAGMGGMIDHSWARAALTKAATGVDQRRPATVTRHTSRATSGSTTCLVTRPGTAA